MAKMIPHYTTADCSSLGEREIFRRLRDDPGSENWIVLHSLDISNHKRRVAGEVDFLIIVPFRGVLCLEVKACKSIRRENGLWYYGDSQNPDHRGPFKQASEAMHSLRRLLIRQKPESSRVVFWPGVIFPYVEFRTNSDEWHSWQVIDSTAYRSKPISSLIETMLDNARAFLQNCQGSRWFDRSLNEPNLNQCEVIAKTLRPNFEFFEDPKTRAELVNEELKHYTEEQYIALDAMESNPRVSFTGPAGTGKTLLAIEAARRGFNSGRRVLLLCYNRLLGKWLEVQANAMQPGVVAKTIHRYMLDVSKLKPGSFSEDFWQTELPRDATGKLLSYLDSEYVFDEIIIDEAQDILRENYLDFLDLSLKGGLAAGRWRLFGDFEKQAIFGAASLPFSSFLDTRALNIPVYSLRVNCRNTPRIASFAHLLGGMEPGYTKVLRSDDKVDPEIFYYSGESEQQTLLINNLQALHEAGFAGNDIIVLSPLVENACSTKIATAPWKSRLSPYETAAKSHIGYSSIYAFKGLEAPCVIITDIARIAEPYAQSLFYTGATRALNRLIILCQESVKTEVVEVLLNK